MPKKILSLFVAVILLCLQTPAQKVTMLYADTVQKLSVYANTAPVLHHGVYSYFPALVSNGVTQMAALVKTDTAGQTLWTAYPLLYPQSETNDYFKLYKRLIKGVDNDLYGLLENNLLIKISDSNGSVEWMRTVFNGHYDYLRDQILDYDEQHLLFTRADYNTGDLQVFKVEKSFGKKVDSIRLYMPTLGANFGGGRTYAIYNHQSQLLVATKDSIFCFNSFDNPTLKWKQRNGFETLQDVACIDVAEGKVITFGNKYNGFQNGYMSCVDLETGNYLWMCKNQGTFDVNYADHQIQEGFIYSAWKHQYVGSTSERCLLNKVNLQTGTIQWQYNNSFRTQPVSVAIQEGITKLLLDKDHIYVTGYAQPDNYHEQSWIFMKWRQDNGAIVAKAFIEQSNTGFDYPTCFSMYAANAQLFATGFYKRRNATLRLDTLLQWTDTPKPITASIQHPSSVHALQPFSTIKKILVRHQGKQLLAEMVNPFFNTVWKFNMGDTTHYYEAHPKVYVTDSNRSIYVAARRYPYLHNQFFYYPKLYTDSLFLFKLDSSGALKNTYRFDDDPQVLLNGFFVDSSKRNWRLYQSTGVAYSAPLDTAMAGPFDVVNARPYATPWRRTIFHHMADSVAMFREQGYYGGASFTIQTQPYWFPGTVQKFLPNIKWINHVAQQNSMQYVVAAKDSADNDIVFQFRADSLHTQWRQSFATSFTSLKVLPAQTSIWVFGWNNTEYSLRQLSSATGTLQQNWIISNPLPAMLFSIADVVISDSKNSINVAGYLTDTAGVPENKLLCVLSFDTLGNLKQTIIRNGYKAWQNKSLAMATGQDGQVLVGGQLSDATRGNAGFVFGLQTQQLVPPSTQVVFTIATGDWHNPAIWNTGLVPTHEMQVQVLHPVSVSKPVICKSLIIQAPGKISLAAGGFIDIKEF